MSYEESQKDKLARKVKDAPFVPLGIAGTLGVLGWGAYAFKNRGEMSTSVFLMHLRVKAQGMIVGAIAIGVGLGMLNEYVVKPQLKKQDELAELAIKK